MARGVDRNQARGVIAIPNPEMLVRPGTTRARRETLGLRVAVSVEGLAKDITGPSRWLEGDTSGSV
jgi:hypothetical protein